MISFWQVPERNKSVINWFLLTLIAAAFLGFYDVAKKSAVTNNAVPPVLLLNVSTAAVIWSIPILLDLVTKTPAGLLPRDLCDLHASDHGLLFGKSLMVGVSWMFAFVALKHLPISIAAPIRATSPMWTIVLALLLTAERPLMIQWIGIALILVAFYAFSFVGMKEGIQFRQNRAVWLMVAATLVSAFCGLYDKYLLQSAGFSPAVVQAWFSIYLVPVMLPMFAYWYLLDRKNSPFQWRWSIPLIAILLLIADYTYFVALAQPDALISVISPLRRTSIIIPFLFGIWFLQEVNWRTKLLSIMLLLAGVYLISLGSS